MFVETDSLGKNYGGVAALTTAGVLLVAMTLARLESGRSSDEVRAAIETEAPRPADVQMVLTASNGVRIYWSVPAPTASRL